MLSMLLILVWMVLLPISRPGYDVKFFFSFCIYHYHVNGHGYFKCSSCVWPSLVKTVSETIEFCDLGRNEKTLRLYVSKFLLRRKPYSSSICFLFKWENMIITWFFKSLQMSEFNSAPELPSVPVNGNLQVKPSAAGLFIFCFSVTMLLIIIQFKDK